MTFTVLQWNVLYQERGNNILSLIKQVQADIVCLQELTQHSFVNPHRDLPAEISALGYHYYYEATAQEPDLILGNGLFSKAPLTNPKSIYVSHDDPSNPDYPQYNRAYIEASTQIGRKSLLIGTAHLSYIPEFTFFPSRQSETDKFLDIVGDKREKFVLTGDFNAMPGPTTMNPLGRLNLLKCTVSKQTPLIGDLITSLLRQI